MCVCLRKFVLTVIFLVVGCVLQFGEIAPKRVHYYYYYYYCWIGLLTRLTFGLKNWFLQNIRLPGMCAQGNVQLRYHGGKMNLQFIRAYRNNNTNRKKKKITIQLTDKPTIFIMMVIIIDRFDIALLSALEQTHCGLVACDSAE